MSENRSSTIVWSSSSPITIVVTILFKMIWLNKFNIIAVVRLVLLFSVTQTMDTQLSVLFNNCSLGLG